MKTLHCFLLVLTAATVPLLRASDSKRTAEYIFTSPTDFEGKQVTLDVSFVKPVPWKSPVSELAFFHAMTIDRQDYKPGGVILVAVPATESGKFAKKYGLDFEGRHESTQLKGTLIAAPGHEGPQVWILDTTEGKVGELVKARKLALQDEGGEMGPGGRGPGPGGPGHHPRRPVQN